MLTATKVYSPCADQSQRDELILNHLWLVRHILGRMAVRLPGCVDLDNLESAGVLGLVEATNKFDPTRGIKFKTFAYNRVRGAILDELRRNCPLPQHMIEHISQIRKAGLQLQPGPVTPEALAAATGLTVDEVADALTAMRVAETVSSPDIDALGSLHAASRTPPPDADLQEWERKEALAAAIAALPERERLIVALYYLEDLWLREIGEVLHLSESRVSRLLSAALFRLKESMKDRDA